ncbi:MAG: hypothetical protein U0234_00700 [Sandaracinus sp.]
MIEVVHTQVTIVGVGIVDLVLDLVGADGRRGSIFVEIKVHAGESGDQLARYAHYVDARPETGVRLVTLARGVVRDGVPALTWRAARRAAMSSSSPLWRDLATFLEEIGMADDHDEPITIAEAGALGSALGLLRKAERIVTATAGEMNRFVSQWSWPSEPKDVRAQLADQFANHRRFVIVNRNRVPAWCFFGIVPSDVGADLAMIVEARPKALDVRRRVLAAGDALPAHWQRHTAGWPLLVARESILEHAEHGDAASWLTARARELEAAGIFALSTKLQVGAVNEDVADET